MEAILIQVNGIDGSTCNLTVPVRGGLYGTVEEQRHRVYSLCSVKSRPVCDDQGRARRWSCNQRQPRVREVLLTRSIASIWPGLCIRRALRVDGRGKVTCKRAKGSLD